MKEKTLSDEIEEMWCTKHDCYQVGHEVVKVEKIKQSLKKLKAEIENWKYKDTIPEGLITFTDVNFLINNIFGNKLT